MNIKINKNGSLEIKRKGKYEVQICPFCLGNDGETECGDWCPLFGELEHSESLRCSDATIKIYQLKICKKTFDDIYPKKNFKDEREEK